MSGNELYAGREQTLVKHYILEHYLERFAHIVGSKWKAVTYVDCFSGPWNARSEKLEDSSFALALTQLRTARENLADLKEKNGQPQLELRCFFLEKEPASFARLQEFAASAPDAEIATRNATLEESIADIIAFVRRRQTDAFPFVFVDPTGWTGFALDVIRPLLQLRPGEVLVNFMTGHIVRFAEHPDTGIRQSFDRLFGNVNYRDRIARLSGQDREEELVRCYAEAIGQVGGFDYVCPAIVLHPEKDRTHFHLLYATRNPRGVEVFKQVERKAMEVMEQARGEAQQRRRQAKSGQMEMFGAADMHDTRYHDQLRTRHLEAARQHVEGLVTALRVIGYDEVWAAALSHPLVWESDLKEWIETWGKAGRIVVDGLKDRQRVPKRGANHRLVMRADSV